MHFANFEAMKRVAGKRIFTTNVFQLVLRIFIIVFLVFSMSGTTLWYEGTGRDNDFVIAIDTSASMSAKDLTETRLDAAKYVAKSIVDSLSMKSKVGLVSFSSVSYIEELPRNDGVSLKASIDALEVESAGGTDIAGAMITSTNILLSSNKGKSIILITDGSNTYNAYIEDSVKKGINYALSKKVIIHTIGIGRESGPIGYLPEFYNISASFNKEVIIDIANSTGGNYYVARDDNALENAIDYVIDKTQKRNIPVDISFGFLLLGLMLLFIEWGLINTRFRKMP